VLFTCVIIWLFVILFASTSQVIGWGDRLWNDV